MLILLLNFPICLAAFCDEIQPLWHISFTFSFNVNTHYSLILSNLQLWQKLQVIPKMKSWSNVGIISWVLWMIMGTVAFWRSWEETWVISLTVWTTSTSIYNLGKPGHASTNLSFLVLTTWTILAKSAPPRQQSYNFVQIDNETIHL